MSSLFIVVLKILGCKLEKLKSFIKPQKRQTLLARFRYSILYKGDNLNFLHLSLRDNG